MRKLAALIFVSLLLGPVQSSMAVNTSVEMTNGVPTICADGNPYNIGGWTVATLGGIWNLSVDEIKQRMDFTKSQGFEVIEIFVPWRKVEWNRNQFWWESMDSLMDYAENIGLYTIVQVTATIAPPWFGDTLYPDYISEFISDIKAYMPGYLFIAQSDKDTSTGTDFPVYNFLKDNFHMLLADANMAANRVAKIVEDLKNFAIQSSVAEKKPMEINLAVKNALRLAKIPLIWKLTLTKTFL